MDRLATASELIDVWRGVVIAMLFSGLVFIPGALWSRYRTVQGALIIGILVVALLGDIVVMAQRFGEPTVRWYGTPRATVEGVLCVAYVITALTRDIREERGL